MSRRFARHRATAVAVLAAAGLAALLGAGDQPSDGLHFELTDALRRRILQHAPLGPAPPDPTNAVADDPKAARLGQTLFFDARLSVDGSVSCATCHDPKLGFADGRELPRGLADGVRNTPTIWNVAHNRWYFWDGRADTLWSQALGPIERDIEMGSTRLAAVHLIHGDPKLRAAYESIFGPMPDLSEPGRFPRNGRPHPQQPDHPEHIAWMTMTTEDQTLIDTIFANLGKAIAAYERRLVAGNTPFDRFVAGLRENDPAKLAALGPSAQRGLALFVGRADCRLCHSGPHFSDGEFHDIGMPPRHGRAPTDAGRYDGIRKLRASAFSAGSAHSDAPTGEAADRTRYIAGGPDNWGRFKTPSLRNVALTAPYMHQGQKATLADVVEYYSTLKDAMNLDHHQEQVLLPLDLTNQEMLDLIAFLESLTGEAVDPSLLQRPDDH